MLYALDMNNCTTHIISSIVDITHSLNQCSVSLHCACLNYLAIKAADMYINLHTSAQSSHTAECRACILTQSQQTCSIV